jgi:large subunit ribosomal protein L4
VADKLVARLYSSAGAEVGEIALDPAVFGIEPNVAVMHQVVTAQLAAARAGTASTKTRGEVSGGGKKPWRQKGLGRARQGSIRAPQFKGGGVVFGPHPRDYTQRTPKKMKSLALCSALSARAAEGEVKVVDAFDWAAPKTRLAVSLLEAMGAGGKVLVVLGDRDDVVRRSLRNLIPVHVADFGQLSTYDVLWADTVVFTKETLALAGGSARSIVDEQGAGNGEGGAA